MNMNETDGKTDYRNIVKSYGDKGQIIGPGIDETTGGKRVDINPIHDLFNNY